MSATPPFLRLKNITKGFDEKAVLTDISFEQHAHEIVCLLGESGSGKTTTLMLIAGVEQPDHGEIHLAGEEIFSTNNFIPPEKRRVGVVFQDYALFPHLSVGRNVSFGIRGLSRGERLSRMRTELARFGLEAYANAYPHQLSGGERQRVALARALAAEPKLLLLDEPFASLDKSLRESLREETVLLLRERACPCIFVTHDPEEACYVADRIVLLHQGNIIQQGTPQELYQHPHSLQAAQFFGKMNHFTARVEGGVVKLGEHFSLPLSETESATRFQEGETVVVAFRPESFSPSPTSLALKTDLLQARFLGKMTEFSLRLQGSPINLRAQLPIGGAEIGGGEFYLDPKAVHLFRV